METNEDYICNLCNKEKQGSAYEFTEGERICGDCIQTGYLVYLQQKGSQEWWVLAIFKTMKEAQAAVKDVMNYPFLADYKIEEAIYGEKSIQRINKSNKVQDISAKELRIKIQSGDTSFEIIDIRESHELAKESSIPGAIHIEIKQLPNKIKTLPKDREYIIVCSHGMRARYICDFFEENGYKAKRLTSGMMGWKGLGFVVTAMDMVTAGIKKFKSSGGKI
ncbi:hypothetical protein SRRS_17920 [Sporomusa rhizae]|uniref:rhodanese-like domain-containing protein n=1 Tax=Sporomusa rhizae TaxID=357999 RepID=UPI003529F04D